jgi:hypothetical protein
MRVTTIAVTAATALAGAAVAAALGAGSAAAATPEVYGPQGFVGVDLNHGETVALANNPIATGVLNALPRTAIGAIAPFSTPRPGLTPAGIVNDAAAAPNGQIGIFLTNPAQWNGKNLFLTQGGTFSVNY